MPRSARPSNPPGRTTTSSLRPRRRRPRTRRCATTSSTTPPAAPVMFAAISRCAGFAGADLSGVRAAIVAGAHVPAALVLEYADRGMLLQQSWGMTETAPAATYLPAGRTRDKAGSAGVEMPHTRIRLVDPATREDLGPGSAGTPGEILVKGPNVTQGYWNDPAANLAAFTDDGWLRTGDLAERDAEGFLTIVGRRTAMINSGGENIYPAEVERALAGLPGVREVAVVGVPHPEWGETVAVVLECPDGATRPSRTSAPTRPGRSPATSSRRGPSACRSCPARRPASSTCGRCAHRRCSARPGQQSIRPRRARGRDRRSRSGCARRARRMPAPPSGSSA
ncbi:AMP-binding protein [Pengzhenrongella sp.]|uniref:AMP-binding protein n=1 Tax=Pengzhenrongella sp. TaxID=2888820 RepID=UPI0039C91263